MLNTAIWAMPESNDKIYSKKRKRRVVGPIWVDQFEADSPAFNIISLCMMTGPTEWLNPGSTDQFSYSDHAHADLWLAMNLTQLVLV